MATNMNLSVFILSRALRELPKNGRAYGIGRPFNVRIIDQLSTINTLSTPRYEEKKEQALTTVTLQFIYDLTAKSPGGEKWYDWKLISYDDNSQK